MKAVTELTAAALRHRVDPAQLGFATTGEVEPLAGAIGQRQAEDAIGFGLETGARGYNLYVSGAPGSGRLQTVLDHLRRVAPERPAPADWIYVHNFDQLDHPIAISLPPGTARRLATEVDELLRSVRSAISRAFESDAYGQRRRAALATIDARREADTDRLRQFALARGFALEPAPNGFIAMPLSGGRPITTEQAQALPEAQRADLDRRGEEVRQAVGAFLHGMRQLEREAASVVRELDREVCLGAIGPLFAELMDRHADSERLLEHLRRVRDDIPNHVGDFVGEDSDEPVTTPEAMVARGQHLDRYRVNAFVDQNGATGAPIVHETNPTYYNLVGRVDYRGVFGMLLTDFQQVKAGALHRANGGYLVVEALDVLSSPFSWQALKRALRAGEVRIENLGEQLSAVPTATLAPQPIPLDVKVVMVGSPLLYEVLLGVDEDFGDLFKVKAEFEPDLAWDAEGEATLAAFVARAARDQSLLPFDAAAVGGVIEYAGRLQEHQRRLSARVGDLLPVVTEASSWAARAGRGAVAAADVAKAIAERERRSGLLERRVNQVMDERTLVIETAGERVGQVNGLSVIEAGDHAFGRPVRVTATVSLGRAGVVSIDRDIELSGPIHSKGVLTLAGCLAATYAQDEPLPIRASISFEQSYEEVEGDSASSAELYALLSALAGRAIRQGVAVTGSVNQHGEVQAIGGVNAKVEGFFRLCRRRGLTGAQGVLIPRANVPHLMLAEDVVEAVGRGEFHVWAVDDVDEGIELLTGVSATEVRSRVKRRLRQFTDRLRAAVPETVVAANGSAERRRRATRSHGPKR